MKWEYLCTRPTSALFRNHELYEDINEILNIYGDQEWELIKIFDSGFFLFKRPKVENSEPPKMRRLKLTGIQEQRKPIEKKRRK